MPTPTRAKPPVSAWIIRERKRLGLKPKDLASRLSDAWLPVTEGTVRTWEAGRRPHPDNVEGLERIFGTRSPDYMAGSGGLISGMPGPADLTRLYELLETQTRAISQLAQAIAGMPTWTPAQWQAAQEAVAELEAEVETPAPPLESDPEPSGASPSAAPGPGRLPAAVL